MYSAGTVDHKLLFNPLDGVLKEFDEYPHLYLAYLFTQPAYFSFICQEILNIEIAPFQGVMLEELWNHRFPMLIGSRGCSKSFTLALYAILRALLIPRRKVLICGSAFRQSKVIFEYITQIYNNAPILRDILSKSGNNGPRYSPDMYRFHIFESTITAIPTGTGEKIRGLRANDVLMDEFKSINRDIFETVIRGFASVKASPIEGMKQAELDRVAREQGIEISKKRKFLQADNQIVLSGTAFYEFNHFCEYWKKYKKIIETKGDKEKLNEIFGDDELLKHADWKDYSIIRIPFDLIPEGFMDSSQIANAKATIHSGEFDCEYGAVFSKDSKGFFPRSLLEKCTVSPTHPINDKGIPILFSPVLSGESSRKYVYAIDPASEIDNFAVTILELHSTHRRIVHVWTINKRKHQERVNKGLVQEHDFYHYCARRIRDFMERFPCERIAIDTQGGGYAVLEALHDISKLGHNEQPIYPVIDPNNPQDSDGKKGLHIVELVNFASADWTSDANHSLKKDFEDQTLLFPYFDAIDVVIAVEQDAINARLYDTLDDCIFEIEELKNELANIVQIATPTGRERWDTADVLDGTTTGKKKKGKMRKDRYSALLMANKCARDIAKVTPFKQPNAYGGWAQSMKSESTTGAMYTGPECFNEAMRNAERFMGGV